MRPARVQSLGTADGVVTIALSGFASFAIIADVLARFEAALGDDPDLGGAVLDVNDLDGFEPGVPARVIHWMAAHADQLSVVCIVTSRPVLLATVRAAEVMVPRVTSLSAPTRAEAVAAVVAALSRRRRRAQTGVRRRATSQPPPEATESEAAADVGATPRPANRTY